VVELYCKVTIENNSRFHEKFASAWFEYANATDGTRHQVVAWGNTRRLAGNERDGSKITAQIPKDGKE
jgi:hypothetical protein